MLVSLLRHADRVEAACQAQLVNVIAPIMTEPGGASRRQTIFHPFALTAQHARGDALDLDVRGPLAPTSRYGDVPAVDGVATYDAPTGRAAVFLVNRSMTEVHDVTVDLRSLTDAHHRVTVTGGQTVSDDDVRARNTPTQPDRVRPRRMHHRRTDEGTVELRLPAASWSVLTLERRPSD